MRKCCIPYNPCRSLLLSTTILNDKTKFKNRCASSQSNSHDEIKSMLILYVASHMACNIIYCMSILSDLNSL